MTTTALCVSEEANVAAKHRFCAALLKAIAKNDREAFKACVEQIGKNWGVCRNVETESSKINIPRCDRRGMLFS